MLIGRVQRYLLRETLMAWLGVTVVLVVVLLTNRLVRFMADAARGDVPPDVIFTLLGLKALANLGVVLPASFFLAVILALGRLYRDSEMAAMAACGVGPRAVLRGLYALAVPLAVVVAALSLTLGPWAEGTADDAVAAASERAQFAGLQGGRFLPLGDDGGVLYVESVADDGTLRGLFARLGNGPEERLVVAERAYRRNGGQGGGRFLVLADGYRYDGVAGQPAWRTLAFGEHGIRVDDRGGTRSRTRRDAQSTPALLADGGRDAGAELQWRVAMPVSVLVLALAAVPLARSAPREGRYARLVAAVLVYVGYFNGLKAAQDWYESGVTPPWLGIWWVHLAVLALAGSLLWRQFGSRR
ncbi:LPS export ABC transporter permease LptF [Arhodomonas sp. AD133]|uniref:LPS export ABC transporter permease LptF n=1 Tax=Arhodomonas sp. AD133 TaxID=3415009 RepID=UPI003EBF6627